MVSSIIKIDKSYFLLRSEIKNRFHEIVKKYTDDTDAREFDYFRIENTFL